MTLAVVVLTKEKYLHLGTLGSYSTNDYQYLCMYDTWKKNPFKSIWCNLRDFWRDAAEMQCMLGSSNPMGCLLNMAGNPLVEPCGDVWRMTEDLDVMRSGFPHSALQCWVTLCCAEHQWRWTICGVGLKGLWWHQPSPDQPALFSSLQQCAQFSCRSETPHVHTLIQCCKTKTEIGVNIFHWLNLQCCVFSHMSCAFSHLSILISSLTFQIFI